MIFNKNQSSFKSLFQREVWWWAVGLVPPSVSLTDDVKNKFSHDVLAGCFQWYEYFNELCEDMYNNEEEYLPASARQYRDLLECISAHGEIRGDDILWNIDSWNQFCNKINKSKAYVAKGITVNQCLKALYRTGLECKTDEDAIIFYNDKYAKIFHAMKTMENSPDIRKTPARHHFAHCEFRQLFKSYSAGYDELLRRASDDSLYIAHSIHDFAKSLNIKRYIHFGIIKYKYKDIRVLDYNLYGDEYPTLRVNIGTCAGLNDKPAKDEYYKYILTKEQGIQDAFIKNIVKCNDDSHVKQLLTINNQGVSVCSCSKIRINPRREDLEALLCFIAARKASIEKY